MTYLFWILAGELILQTGVEPTSRRRSVDFAGDMRDMAGFRRILLKGLPSWQPHSRGFTLISIGWVRQLASSPSILESPNRGSTMQSVLGSWKEIASYLGKGVRTVQRWERCSGLPIHRPSGTSKGVVIAFPAELDQWVRRQDRDVRLFHVIAQHQAFAPTGGSQPVNFATVLRN